MEKAHRYDNIYKYATVNQVNMTITCSKFFSYIYLKFSLGGAKKSKQVELKFSESI